MERMNAWEKYPEGKKRNEVFDFAEEYRKFLSDCKTERECVTYFAQKAEKAGFVNLDTVLEKGTKLAAGDKVYANNMGKGLALFVIGEKSMEHGMNILGAHIDSPRMDLKQDPLYEDTDFAMLDTHYYGGIKKYQWVTLPLALHGVIAKKDGTVVKVSVGDKPGDPVFGVSDLLIHLSGEQMEKKAAKVIEGENLDLIIGSIPAEADEKDDVKEKVKANIMKILAKEYDIEEEDFLSAEIEVVPAGEARDYGFDRSMIMGYGHDDRVCAYPSFEAIAAMEKPEITSVCLLVDKEEIGSVGASGMQSRFFENILGRSKNFWIPIYAQIQELLPEFKKHSLDEFCREINHVQNSMIRTEADEVTYCLHIILRYEMEQAIFRDHVPVSELPALWNQKMQDYLQITPSNDAEGILQDMHWSDGSFGYFPSYLLGSIYDGMFLETLEQDLGNIDEILASGQIHTITKWLNEKIHWYGSLREPKEVIHAVCGKELSAKPLLDYFTKKYTEVYHLS